jgi:DNA adenine methylase
VSRHRTPLRYPGGKQKLAPFVDEILRANDAVGWNYVEPYAGGAGVAMQLLLADRVRRVYLNDSSPHVYAFWRSILRQPEAFCQRISRCALNIATWRKHREVFRFPGEHDALDLGFSTFYLNRCNRSGVLTAGVIGGLEQEGDWTIDARFPRKELIKRIEAIAEYASRIVVSNQDAEAFLVGKVNSLPAQTLVYCDPPYFARAERLYLDHYEPDDHVRLANVIQSKLKRPWLVSYDGHSSILSLYGKRRHFLYSLHYSAMRSYAGAEVFVFSDDLNIPRTSDLSYVAPVLEELPMNVARRRRALAVR